MSEKPAGSQLVLIATTGHQQKAGMAEKAGMLTTALTQETVEVGNRRDTSWTPTTADMYSMYCS
jgi:hypothetical protein